MHGFDPFQIVVMVLAAIFVVFVMVALTRSIRRATHSRRRESRLAAAFDRARYVRRHGSVPVGSQYGIYENRVRSVSAMR
jgi:uncharacterized membrane protein